MERLSIQDASFIYLENEYNHMSIAALAIFEGPAPAEGELEQMISSRLDLVPRFRQRLRFVPLDLGRPVWCDDPHFTLRYHIRHTALPTPGADEQLQLMVGRLMSQQLDRTRPLWEIWVVEGLSAENWGMLLKLHHCVADGVAATDLLGILLDKKRKPPKRKPRPWIPEPQPSLYQLSASAMTEHLTSPRKAFHAARSAMEAPREAARKLRDFLDGLNSFRDSTKHDAESSLNGPVGPHRNWRWHSASLPEIKRIRSTHGGTINDVVLAVITRGFRALLQSRGEPVDNYVVRSLVPVSVRREDEHSQVNNRVSAMLAELPVGIEDPLQNLAAISAQMSEHKEHHQAVAGEILSSLSGLAPPALVAMGSHLFAGMEQHAVQTVTTNVPGPKQALYAVGRKMLTAFLYVPIAGSVRIGVAMFSYEDTLTFAVTGDYDHAPDTDVLCKGIEAGIAELSKEREKQAGDRACV
jgi:diacylglycerol O-acyltransferase